MSYFIWDFMTGVGPDGIRDAEVAFALDQSTGSLVGNLIFQRYPFVANGSWYSAGPEAGGNITLAMFQALNDAGGSVNYVGACTTSGPASAPSSMLLYLTRVDAQKGLVSRWKGELLPVL